MGVHSGNKIDFGPTVSTYIVKKFRFFAQWAKKNGPKTIFVPLCPEILSKSLDFVHSGTKKAVQNRLLSHCGQIVVILHYLR